MTVQKEKVDETRKNTRVRSTNMIGTWRDKDFCCIFMCCYGQKSSHYCIYISHEFLFWMLHFVVLSFWWRLTNFCHCSNIFFSNLENKLIFNPVCSCPGNRPRELLQALGVCCCLLSIYSFQSSPQSISPFLMISSN